MHTKTPQVDVPFSTKDCAHCSEQNAKNSISASTLLADRRKALCKLLETEDLTEGEFKAPAGISKTLAKIIAHRSNNQIENLKPFADAITNGPIRAALDKIFNSLWDIQLEENPENNLVIQIFSNFFSFWLIEHIWPKWESGSSYKTPGFVEDVLQTYTKLAEERGVPFDEKQAFIAVVAKMSDGIVKYFSGPAEVVEMKESDSTPIQTSESVPIFEENELDLATEVSSLDTVPTLLFLILLYGLIFVDKDTPQQLQIDLVECMSSCLAITLGPKSVSHILVAFISAFLQEYKGIHHLLVLGQSNEVLTRPILHIIASLLDIMDDFNIISEKETFSLLLRESWQSLSIQTKLVEERCKSPMLFVDIAFRVIQNVVSLLHISRTKTLIGDDFPPNHIKPVLDALETIVNVFERIFKGKDRNSGVTLASAAKIHNLLKLCTEILPQMVQLKVQELRNKIENHRTQLFVGSNAVARSNNAWNWDFMLSSKQGVKIITESGVLDKSYDGKDFTLMCACEINQEMGYDFNEAKKIAGHFCHICRPPINMLTPKLVLAQKVFHSSKSGYVEKKEITNIDEWMDVIDVIKSEVENEQKERPKAPGSTPNSRPSLPIDKEELSVQRKLINLETLDIDKLLLDSSGMVSRAFTSIHYGNHEDLTLKIKRQMTTQVRSTQIIRVSDGLPLVATMESPKEEEELSNHKKLGKFLVRSLAPDLNRRSPDVFQSKASIVAGNFTYHYLVENDVVFLALCDRSYPRLLAFSYLMELCRLFFQSASKNEIPVAKVHRPYTFIKFGLSVGISEDLASLSAQIQSIPLQHAHDVLGDDYYKILVPTNPLESNMPKIKIPKNINLDEVKRNVTATINNLNLSDASTISTKQTFISRILVIMCVIVFLVDVLYFIFWLSTASSSASRDNSLQDHSGLSIQQTNRGAGWGGVLVVILGVMSPLLLVQARSIATHGTLTSQAIDSSFVHAIFLMLQLSHAFQCSRSQASTSSEAVSAAVQAGSVSASSKLEHANSIQSCDWSVGFYSLPKLVYLLLLFLAFGRGKIHSLISQIKNQKRRGHRD
ncbi:SNAP receptor [Nowakowskiella sp. JEL0078]|nr:SNAP receptor [Nowakowskiella sp. JEL0078]